MMSQTTDGRTPRTGNVCNVRPEMAKPNRLRMMLGGDRIDIDMDCETPTACLLTAKLLLNSVASTPS